MNQQRDLAFNRAERLDAFVEFHKANPSVWRKFVQLAREAKRAGKNRFSARPIGERIRWHFDIDQQIGDFKINDHHWPYYARLLMAKYPEQFEGFFIRKDRNFDCTDDELLRAVSS